MTFLEAHTDPHEAPTGPKEAPTDAAEGATDPLIIPYTGSY